MLKNSREPLYKYGDLVWRPAIGFGIVIGTHKNKNKEWDDPNFYYTIMWDRDNAVRDGFQEWEIASMRYDLENAS